MQHFKIFFEVIAHNTSFHNLAGNICQSIENANGGAKLFSLKLHNQKQTIVLHMPMIEIVEKGTQEDECHDTIDLPTSKCIL